MVEFSISIVLKWYEKSAHMTFCSIQFFICFSLKAIPLLKKKQSLFTKYHYVYTTYNLDAGSTKIFFGRIEGYNQELLTTVQLRFINNGWSLLFILRDCCFETLDWVNLNQIVDSCHSIYTIINLIQYVFPSNEIQIPSITKVLTEKLSLG